jgi:signal peptidase I
MSKKIVNCFSWLLILIIFIVGLYIMIMYVNDKEISLFGYKLYVIKTDSMEPTLNINDVILSCEEEYKDLDKNTIITFDFNDKLNLPNTHRIVGYYYRVVKGGQVKYGSCYNYDSVELLKKDNPDFEVIGYRTKGDNEYCEIDVEPVLFESIRGVYIRKIKLLSVLFIILTNFYGFLFLIFIPLVILLIVQLNSILTIFNKTKRGC